MTAEYEIGVQGIDVTTYNGTILLELCQYFDLHATRGFPLPLEKWLFKSDFLD
jgi:hypothetical protein